MGVKSFKFHLKRIIGKFILAWHEMLTILCRIEACLNSRPISKLYDDPDILDVITPGHFLIGAPLLSLPETSIDDVSENRLKRFQHVQKIVEQFWKKCSHEYLNTLQTRPKWREKLANLKTGDIVLIKDPLNPPCRWTMGRIVEAIKGRNEVVRIVVLRTAKIILKHNVTQICPLIST